METAEIVKVTFPDGSAREYPRGTTVLDVARSIGPRLAEAALVGKMNGDLVELSRPIEGDTQLRILTAKDAEALDVYRHSSAHLLAAAVFQLHEDHDLRHCLIDNARRFALFRDAERILCAEELPIIPLFFRRGNYLLIPRLGGVCDNVRDILPIQRVRIER